jgi:hypothetical protein
MLQEAVATIRYGFIDLQGRIGHFARRSAHTGHGGFSRMKLLLVVALCCAAMVCACGGNDKGCV